MLFKDPTERKSITVAAAGIALHALLSRPDTTTVDDKTVKAAFDIAVSFVAEAERLFNGP